MLIRALVVLLLVLNLGVAAWWAMRSPPPAPQVPEPPLGVARLQLAREARPASVPAAAVRPAAPAAGPAATPTLAAPPAPAPAPAPLAAAAPAMPAQCYSFGPFADAQAAQNARELLMAVATKVVPRQQPTASSKGWRVHLPAAASLAEAQATSQRIAAAGFSDYFIVREGSEANSIALGRYRSEDSANRRAQSLVAAGFPARAEPLGEGRMSHWLDLVPGKDFDPARAQAAVVVSPRTIDCARLQ